MVLVLSIDWGVSVPLRGLDIRKRCHNSSIIEAREGFSPLAGIRYSETQLSSQIVIL